MLTDFLTGVVYIAIVYVLVQPNSKVSTAITDVTDALSNMVQAAIKGSVS